VVGVRQRRWHERKDDELGPGFQFIFEFNF